MVCSTSIIIVIIFSFFTDSHTLSKGRPRYVFVVNDCWHETNKIYEGYE